MPLFSWQSCFAAGAILVSHSTAFTGHEYALSHEYSGLNFFEGWDFFTGRDPTGGFVTYYSHSSSQLTGLIKTSEDGPAYMGVNYEDKLPLDNTTGRGDGAGRPSTRIASKQAFTHGLFIGDFEHIPAGICGTWPAFWTLGPNWPYTGEIDILEGVNANMNNVMSLHTNETCIITGDETTMTGSLENINCAYYPDYNVGCGVKDDRSTSFGIGFNQAGGGVYAMQWTSEAINIWHWPRSEVPEDVDSKSPDPGSWGLPAAQLAVGNCTVNQHFQSHKIIFDTTFCGEYAGNPNVWKTDDASSCAGSTGLNTCDNYVANNPEAFEEAYWSVKYVRVYQLVDPEGLISPLSTYIASEQPPNSATETYTALAAVATLDLSTAQLCPQYNYSIISDGKYQYEIACDMDPPGPDIQGQPYDGFSANSLADCISGCTYMNERSPNKCGGVSHFASINFCYFKKYIDGTPKYRKGYNEIRLIYYGYPQITDDPRSTADSTFTSAFVEIIPTPQTYRPLTTTPFTTPSSTSTLTSSVMSTTSESATLPPAMGDNSTSTSTLPPDYSETVTGGYANATGTIVTGSSTSVVTSSRTSAVTEPEATNADFLIAFNVPDTAMRRLAKRAVKYLAFDEEGDSVLVTSEAEAAKFYLDGDGSVKTGTDFVAIDTTSSPPRFSAQAEKPADPVNIEIDESGSVSVDGVDGYCLTSNGNLAVVPEGDEATEGCQALQPEVISAPSDSSSTTTTSGSTSDSSSASTSMSVSTSSMGTSPTTTSGTTPASDSSSSTSRSVPKPSYVSTSPRSASTSTTVSIRISTTIVGGSSSITTNVSRSRTGTSTSSSSSSPTTAPRINDFIYAGCFGVPQDASSLPGISIPFTDDSMTNEKCTARCTELSAYYAGTHETNCFCGTDVNLYSTLLDYPDASCNVPCPGSNRQMCGGNVLFEASVPSETGNKSKRQANLLLISLYNNTALLPQPGEDDGPSDISTGTRTGAGTVTGTITDSPTSTNDSGLSFPIDSISYNITGTNTATVISTTYIDVCNICPGGTTTNATTITVPHCGCTASYNAHLQMIVSVPSPVVPMMTTAKQCACGYGGSTSVMTVTVPHTDSIQELAAMITQNAAAMAPAMGVPAAAANNNVISSGFAPAFAGPAAPTQGEDKGTMMPESMGGLDALPVDAGVNAPAADAVMNAPNMHITPTGASGMGNTNGNGLAPINVPAPASPASTAGSTVNGNANVNAVASAIATVPKDLLPAINGTISAPIESFKSAANRLARLGKSSSTPWAESRYLLSFLVGAFLAGSCTAW